MLTKDNTKQSIMLALVPVIVFLLFATLETQFTWSWFNPMVVFPVVIIAGLVGRALWSRRRFGKKDSDLFTYYVQREDWETVDPEIDWFAMPPHSIPHHPDHRFQLARRATYGRDGSVRLVVQQYIGNQYGNNWSWFFIADNMEKELPGWVNIQSTLNGFLELPDDQAMESIAFNTDTALRASTARLAQAVCSPNLMDWYNGLREQPWIHVENSTVCVGFLGDPTPEKCDLLVSYLPDVVKALKTSGALEQKT